MSDERVKMEQDLSGVVDVELPKIDQLAQSGRLSEALEQLMVLEKQTRTAADLASSSRVLIHILKLCKDANDWTGLNENIVLLSKKRGQLKQAIAKMVQEAMSYLDHTPDQATKLSLIDTLRSVTEGKIFVEIERARLTRLLAKIKEDENKVAEAADILQQLQVETFGSMEKREKVDFILEQMRLLLAKKDYVRTGLVCKKIGVKFFEREEFHDLKIRYYELMVQLGISEERYLDVCKYYRQIYETPRVAADETLWKQALKCIVVYIILSPFDNEQSDLIHRIYEDKRLAELPVYHGLLRCFITTELMRWNAFEQTYKQEILTNRLLAEVGGEGAWKVMHDRLIEHNIRVIAKYYSRITTQRLNKLLDLSDKETEAFLSKLVVSKTVYARIDRPAGVISFLPKQNPNAVLNTWATSINSLLGLIERSTHLITKEEMVHQITQVK